MKKLAIFVEGQTEQIFVEKLLKEIAGKNNIVIDILLLSGKRHQRNIHLIEKNNITTQTKFYVLIYNSSNDEQVVSDMRDQCISLAANGYERIIGLRDVHPKFIYADKPKLERGLRHSLSQVLIPNPIPMNIILAVMEIESWFLSEWNHFKKVDTRLTPTKIQTELGFNPETDDMETRPVPSEDMTQIYRLVGKSYSKNKSQVNSIVSILDYEFLYLELINTVPSLGEFINYIHLFIN